MSSFTSASRRSTRGSGSSSTREAAAALAYVECVWDLALAIQEATVFKVQMEYIEQKIKEVQEMPGPDLTENEAHELATWRDENRAKMDAWLSKSEVTDLEAKAADLRDKYDAARTKNGRGVYEAPRFIINPMESQVRLDIQRKYDVSREFLIMTNTEEVISHNVIDGLRAMAGRGRAVYSNCSLIKPEFAVQRELSELQAAGDAANSYKIWIPVTTARLSGVDRYGAPVEKDPWPRYFSSLGYKRLEILLTSPVQPLQPPPPQEESSGDESESDMSPGPYFYSEPPPPPTPSPPRRPRRQQHPVFPPPAAVRQQPPPPPAPAPARRRQQQPRSQPPPPPAPLQPHPFGNPHALPLHPPPPAPIAAPIPVPAAAAAAAAAAPNPNPNNPYGRPQPYNPTPQPTLTPPGTHVQTKWNKVRGNTPGNVDVFYFDKLYNRKDSNYNKADRQAAKRAREDGTTRDLALDELVSLGMLPQGFRDLNP